MIDDHNESLLDRIRWYTNPRGRRNEFRLEVLEFARELEAYAARLQELADQIRSSA